MINKKGQVVTVMFFVLMFIIVWIMFFANQLNYWGQLAIVNGNFTGIVAFVYGNINLIIGVVLLLFIMGTVYFNTR